MQSERWEKVKEIFASALERDAAERSLFVEQACANDPELREEVRSLLSAHEDADDFISQPAAQRAGLVHEARSVEWIGRRLGYYRIVAEIGRGGMSQVFKAVRDDDQYEKEVAIKLLRPGLDTESLLRRFKAERQILAQLSHPHIAHLLDGGTTEQGSPYLVMEYIEGQPIDEYCTEHDLSLTQRLDLFRTLCLAVHYVHQHLMVHGDIKGSNVFVTQDGVVKLLDFGIAKLLNPTPALSLDEQRATGFLALTPEYASPEQIRGEAITTASDVYSLGVLLYRLLAGELPYDVEGSTTWELATKICGHEATPPSAVATRQVGVHQSFAREVEGDLDNIVLKALKKLPHERYGSAEQLAQDIRSYLRGFPVQARPDTTRYRVRKFAERHKAATIAASLFVVAMITGIVATSWQAHVARVERARAERHFRDVRELTNAYMSDVYDAVEKLPGATAVRRLLVENSLKYLSGLEREAQDSEELQRDLAYTYEKLGDVQGDYLGANLGDTEGAIKSYRHALALREALLKRNPTTEYKQELLRSHVGLSELLIGLSDVKNALTHARAAAQLGSELIASRNVTDVDRRHAAAALGNLGWAEGFTGQLDQGMRQLTEARALYRQLYESKPLDRLTRRDMALVHARMANVLFEGHGRAREALPLLEEASRFIEPLSAERPTDSDLKRGAAFMLITRAEVENILDRPRAALEKAQIALQRLEDLQRADPVNQQAPLAVAYALGHLSDSYARLGDHHSALDHLNRAATILRRSPASKPTDISEIRLLGASTYTRLARVHAALAAKAAAQRGTHRQQAQQWSQRAIASLSALTNDAVLGQRARRMKAEAERIAAER